MKIEKHQFCYLLTWYHSSIHFLHSVSATNRKEYSRAISIQRIHSFSLATDRYHFRHFRQFKHLTYLSEWMENTLMSKSICSAHRNLFEANLDRYTIIIFSIDIERRQKPKILWEYTASKFFTQTNDTIKRKATE